MKKTREELKHERSMRASMAARARWDQYHADLIASGVQIIYDDPRPHDLYSITVENISTGKIHTLTMHPGPRNNNYTIDLDGREWKTGGFSRIMEILRKSLVKTKPGRIL